MGQVPSLVYLHQIEPNFSSVIDINFAKSVQCPCSLGKSKKPHSFQSIKKLHLFQFMDIVLKAKAMINPKP